MSNSSDEGQNDVTLSDRFYMIKETSDFRQQITDKEKENDSRMDKLLGKLEDLSEKIEASNNGTSRCKQGKGQRKSIVVPKQCRLDFRRHYQSKKKATDFNGFDMSEGVSSPKNKEVFSRICQGIKDEYSGNCPWSLAALRESCITYFNSLNDALRRKKTRTTEQHKILCRRQGRMREKLSRRNYALQKADWKEESKEEIKKVLTPEYTSSDESEYEDSSDTEEPELSCYNVKPLPWQRSRLGSIKRQLDNIYVKSLPKRTRAMLVPRQRKEGIISTRSVPDDIVSWAVRMPVATTIGNSTNSSQQSNDASLSPVLTSTPVRPILNSTIV